MNISRNTTNNNQACAACKFQRKKCAPNCILAPYFPQDRRRQFLNAHKLFGVKKITTIIKHLDPDNKDRAMHSIIFQSDMRAKDPVGGCFRHILELEAQIKYYEAELELVLQQLAVFRSQAHQIHQHHDYLNLYNNHIALLPTAPTHYQYHQHHLLTQEEPYMMLNHQQEHQNGDVVSLQDRVSACWVQDSLPSSSLSLQNKNGGYVGDELYNDQKPSSSFLDIHCYDERNGIGFESEELLDRSDEGVLFKIENAVLKEETNCIQQDQDHDLKGAATLFTLTNFTT